jgi:hypothetical protein
MYVCSTTTYDILTTTAAAIAINDRPMADTDTDTALADDSWLIAM